MILRARNTNTKSYDQSWSTVDEGRFDDLVQVARERQLESFHIDTDSGHTLLAQGRDYEGRPIVWGLRAHEFDRAPDGRVIL